MLTVWGCRLIRGKGKPRPEVRIRLNTILTPFLYPITNGFIEDEKHKI